MRIIFYIFFLIVVILGAVFSYLNAAPVNFNYYLGIITIPLSLLLVFALGIGILLGFLVMLFPWIKLKSKNMGFKRKLKVAEQEIQNLRSIPIKESH